MAGFARSADASNFASFTKAFPIHLEDFRRGGEIFLKERVRSQGFSIFREKTNYMAVLRVLCCGDV